MKRETAILIPLLLIGLFSLTALNKDGAPLPFPTDRAIPELENSAVHLRYMPVFDTIYILSDRYIKISLKEQTATLVRRNDTSVTYGISSGTSNISEGMDTPPGVFTVQLKARAAESRQFNNAKLLYWIGFNNNIGFHGLETKGYYRHLGKRPSSHGCVRIGVEDGKELFYEVSVGTPVLVVDEAPARIFAFADQTDFRPEYDLMLQNKNTCHKRIMKRRLKNLYAGNALTHNIGKVFLDGRTILKPHGFKAGIASEVPLLQEIPHYMIPAPGPGSDKLICKSEYHFSVSADSSVIASD